MTKADLIQKVHTTLDGNVSKNDISRVLDALHYTAIESLKGGNPALLPGFGTLKVVERAAKKGRNPQTGKPMDIPARKAVKYTPSQSVKSAVM